VPRSGWIASGAALAALGSKLIAGEHGRLVEALLVAALVVGLGTTARALARRPGCGRSADRATALALAGLGVLLVATRLALAPLPRTPGAMGALPTGDGPWSGLVLSVGAPKSGAAPAVIQLDPPAGIVVAATLPLFPAVVPGDRLSIRGQLRPPPVGDPFADYLARIGASATIRAASITVAPADGDLGRQLEGMRRGADQALGIALPEPEAGLASGILVGLRDRVDRDLTAAFTAVGATHVVAISGWNIAIVASTLAALGGRLRRRRRMALTAIAILGYVAFVGPSPSVLRAAGMAGVVMAARELGRPSRAAAAIGWAITGLLMLSPPMIEDPGFRLSALATVGLISWGTPLTERLAGPDPGRLRAWLAESLGVSLAAQLATLPVVVMSFGRLSIVSPLVNLGVVPLVAPAMGAGALALLGGLLAMGGLPGVVGTVLGLPGWALFAAIVALVRAGAGLPFASIKLEPPWDAVVAAAAGILIIVTARWLRRERREQRREAGRTRAGSRRETGRGSRHPGIPAWAGTRGARLLGGGLASILVALAIVVVHRPAEIPRLTVLDVGQGDAILLEGSRGGRLLIDGGPDPGRLLIALEEHLPPWDRRLDLVILSHPHEDHAAGLAALLDRYAVRRVLEPGMIGPGPGYAALNAELIARNIARGTLATGDRLSVDDVQLRVLWPDPGSVPERPPDGGTGINNVSIVLLGEVEGHRILLAGDIEEGIDPTLLARGMPSVEVLKVAHHGSRTSSTEPFLAATRPQVAVISAGRGNPYGHPAPATVDRLRAAGAHVFRTDDDGSVTVDLGPGPIHAHAGGGRRSSAAGWPTGFAASRRTATANLLCGLPGAPANLPRRAAMADQASTSAMVASAGSIAAVRSFGPSASTSSADGHLGYASVRDDPRAQSAALALASGVGTRARGLLLGRRRLRHRGGGRGLQERLRPLPGRGPRALADPGRAWGWRPPPR